MKICEAFDKFIFFKRASLLPKSIDNYHQFIAPFVRFVGADRELSSLSQDDVIQYQISINESDCSSATKGTKLRNVKVFLKWCIDSGYLCEKFIDVRKIVLPKAYKKPISPLTDDQVIALFDAIKAENEWMTARNRLIVSLMYDSGLRQSEVAGLIRAKVYESTMIVCGKGGKERTVPIGSVSKRFLDQYCSLCPYQSEYLFVDRRGNRMTNNAIKVFVQKLKSKLPFPVFSHLLRHNFATNYLLDQLNSTGSADLYSLQSLMGHEDIKTTGVYLHFAMSIYASKNYNSHLDKVLSMK